MESQKSGREFVLHFGQKFALSGKVTPALMGHLCSKAFGYTGKLPQSNLNDEGVGV